MVEFHFILEDDEAENLMDIIRDAQHLCQRSAMDTDLHGTEVDWFNERAKYIKSIGDKVVGSCRKVHQKEK